MEFDLETESDRRDTERKRERERLGKESSRSKDTISGIEMIVLSCGSSELD